MQFGLSSWLGCITLKKGVGVMNGWMHLWYKKIRLWPQGAQPPLEGSGMVGVTNNELTKWSNWDSWVVFCTFVLIKICFD